MPFTIPHCYDVESILKWRGGSEQVSSEEKCKPRFEVNLKKVNSYKIGRIKILKMSIVANYKL